MACTEKQLAYARRYRERHPDRIKAQDVKQEPRRKAWIAANRELVREIKRRSKAKMKALRGPKPPRQCVALSPEQKREKKRLEYAVYCAKYPDRKKASSQRYLDTHKDEIRERRAGQRKEEARKRYEKKRDHILAQTKEYAKKNADKLRDAARRWRAKNAERLKEENHAYYLANKDRLYERCLANTRKRLARLKSSTGTHTADQIAELFKKQKGKCATCKKAISMKKGPQKFHVDHVMPLVRGGSNGIENIALQCAKCNQSKHMKHPDEWARMNGLLFI